MKTKKEVQAIRQEYNDVAGEKAEVFDVMYANFDDILDIAEIAPELLAACKALEEHLGHYIRTYENQYQSCFSVVDMQEAHKKMTNAIAKATK